MKKVMLYINTLGNGGAERVMTQLANRFVSEGIAVCLVTSFPVEGEYSLVEGVKRYNLEEKELVQSRIMRNYSRIVKLRKLCKAQRPDVLISFMLEPNFRAVLATRGLPVKTLVSVRNDPNREYAGFIGRIVGKVILPLADGCVFQTEQVRAWFPVRLQKKSKIIMNAVDEAFFQVRREDAANIVSVGRLNPQKNHIMLIDAFSQIATKHPKEKLLIYGKGDCGGAIAEHINKLGLEDRVILKGATADVPGVLAKAKVFVLSSDYEGMPNALLEALAVGVPSISTDCPCGGPRALIKDEENGLLVPVGDVDAMAEAMDRLLSDTEFADRLGNAARSNAERFAPEKTFLEWKMFTERVMECED